MNRLKLVHMSETIPAFLLAGGRASRIGGGDKCLRVLDGSTLLTRVIRALRPQAGRLILNANGDPLRFAGYELPVVADDLPDHPGPLAGIVAGLDWTAANEPQAGFALSVSTDCPFLPPDLVARLLETRVAADADIVLAASNGRLHPVIGLWRVALRQDLRRALVEEGLRKVERFCDRHRMVRVNFPVIPFDPFFNVNTVEDLATAEAMLKAGASPSPAGKPS